MTDTKTRANAPTLRWAVRLLAVETILIAAAAVYVAYEVFAATPTSKQSGAALLVFVVICAFIVGGLSRALWNFRTWARGPAIVVELLLLPIGYYMATGGASYLGIPVMIVGLFGAGLLLAPATRTALGLDRYGDR